MFLVEMDVRLGFASRPMTDDEITDLIERLVDELDRLPVEPSVGTARAGDDVDMTVGVVVDDDDETSALRHGAAIIRTALEAVGMDTAKMSFPGVDARGAGVRALQLT